jgi:hypothetical protein
MKRRTSSPKKVSLPFTSPSFRFRWYLFGRLSSANDAWTEEEVKQIIQFLKQRGKGHVGFYPAPSPLTFMRRDEGLPHGVRACTPDTDCPHSLCVRYFVGQYIGYEASTGAQRTLKCKELREKQLKTQMYFLKVVIFQVYAFYCASDLENRSI